MIMRKFIFVLLFSSICIGFIVAIIIIIGSKLNIFEKEAIGEKFIYKVKHTDSTNIYDGVHIASTKRRAYEVIDFYGGHKNRLIGGSDLEEVRRFVRVKVLKYEGADSALAYICTKYKYGVAPRVNYKEGYVPSFTLHDSLPYNIQDTISMGYCVK